jgi:hypothetical protein
MRIQHRPRHLSISGNDCFRLRQCKLTGRISGPRSRKVRRPFHHPEVCFPSTKVCSVEKTRVAAGDAMFVHPSVTIQLVRHVAPCSCSACPVLSRARRFLIRGCQIPESEYFEGRRSRDRDAQNGACHRVATASQRPTNGFIIREDHPWCAESSRISPVIG